MQRDAPLVGPGAYRQTDMHRPFWLLYKGKRSGQCMLVYVLPLSRQCVAMRGSSRAGSVAQHTPTYTATAISRVIARKNAGSCRGMDMHRQRDIEGASTA